RRILFQTIIPVPKKLRSSCLNDYHSVALTSFMKCFEKLVRDFITSSLPASIDPLQFAYRQTRSTDDIIAHLLHTTLTHLDKGRGNYVKMLFSTTVQHLTLSSPPDSLPNVSKTKELIVDCSKNQEWHCQPVRINGTTLERVDSFRYLGVHISQDLSWSHHTQLPGKEGSSASLPSQTPKRRLRCCGTSTPALSRASSRRTSQSGLGTAPSRTTSTPEG
ncbi:hypothetical protein P4O66_019344, partial [Electrophorus voltai]